MAAFATWKGESGINAFWPLGGMQVDNDDAGHPRVRPQTGTYLFADGPGNYTTLSLVPDTWHFRSDVLAMIKAAGFDHVRLQYEPTPIMWALKNSDNDLMNFVLSQFDLNINAILGAGLGVMLSGILTGFANLMPISSVLAGLTAPNYLLYKQHLTTLAMRYVAKDPAFFAIELLNEPPANGSTTVRPPGYFNWGVGYTGDWQTDYQPDLYALMRDAMPLHTMVLTCDGWSNWNIITSYDPTPYLGDTNIIWEYHPLSPATVAFEGYIYNQYFYVQRLSYPPGANRIDPAAGTLAGSVAQMAALVDLYPDVQTGGDPAGTKAGLSSDLGFYYNQPQNLDWMSSNVGLISDWANRYKFYPGNLYAGEYGCTRDNTGFPGNLLGPAQGSVAATRIDRIHAYRDMSTAVISEGHRRAPDHLDSLNYGITKAQNNKIGVFDPLIINALRPSYRNLRMS